MDHIDKTFIEAIFTPDYYKGYKALENYVVKIVFGILQDMSIIQHMQKNFVTADEIIERFNLHAQSRPLLNWMLYYLEYMGYVKNDNARFMVKEADFNRDTYEELKELLESMPTADIFIRLVTHIKKEIGYFFKGAKRGGDILFADEKISNLWNDYFNNKFSGYSTLNYGAAYGITKWYSETKGKTMLEIGSGTSGATVRVFQMLRDNNLLDSMSAIVLSDVVPSLLDIGKDNIYKHIKSPPGFEQKILDISRPFKEQGFSGETFDIIYGVNVLHIAHDLEYSLKEIYNHLNKNGILVIAETIRPDDNRAMHPEIIFNLLDTYYNVKFDPASRPYHGFLTKARWSEFFERAGFENIEYLDEFERKNELDFDIKPFHSFLVLKGQRV